MSGYTVLSAVSKTLKALLLDRMEAPLPLMQVTIAPPDVKIKDVLGKRLNLYLYWISVNSALSNQEVPGYGDRGAFGQSPLALDLHYLLTTYGSDEDTPDADLEAQILLGDAMRVLHDFAILTDELRLERIAGHPLLLPSELRRQNEPLRITLRPTSLDEVAKIWTALPHADFRRSAAYQVSPVQIESPRPRRPPKPVEERRLHMTFSRRPELTSVYRTPGTGESPGDPRVEVGEEITLLGLRLAGTQTVVRVGAVEPPLLVLSDEEIRFTVPDVPSLQPGPQAVEVRTEHPTEVVSGGLGHGKGSAETRVLASNQVFFLLVPKLDLPGGPFTGKAAGSLVLTGSRLYDPDLPTVVVVGDVPIPLPPQPSSTSVTVPLAGLAGLSVGTDYSLRVLVNGVQSRENATFRLLPP